MKKENYKLPDFIADTSFRNWVLRSNQTDTTFWDNWIKQNPSKSDLIEEAKHIIEVLELSRHKLSETEIHLNWQELESKIDNSQLDKEENELVLSTRSRRRWFPAAIAASIILFISVGIIFWQQFNNQERVYFADFGETRTIWLPDSSQIILNANSEIRFDPQNWNGQAAREIFLSGEAYFDVRHLENVSDKRFLVHTPDLSVEVLGTTFNVSHRTERTRVVLNTGKVQLSHKTLQDTIIMEPGDLVELTDTIIKRRVLPERYISWTEHKFLFDDTSLREIAEIIANNYGLEVEIKGEEIAERSLTGEVVVESVDDLLLLLRSSLGDIKITREEQALIFEAED